MGTWKVQMGVVSLETAPRPYHDARRPVLRQVPRDHNEPYRIPRSHAAACRRALRGPPTATSLSTRRPPAHAQHDYTKKNLLRYPVRSTTLVPSRNCVRKSTFAFVNRPSFSLFQRDDDGLGPAESCAEDRVSICCVCERSGAVSISSRMYISAGLNLGGTMISDSPMSDLNTHMYD